ncbi:HNH endonuclease [Halorubrum pallidum]|uniref:HNH endonuclease n=1 Tax=Halorubrum pallidum TaxID=1526114 RepID=A0ABD5T1W2_9EURY
MVEGIPLNGKTFDAKIHEISDSGNGLVETTETKINLGPVEAGAVGERVEAMKLPGKFARIKRPKKILKSDYIEKLQSMTPYDFSIDYGDAHQNISKHGLRKQENIGAILEYVPNDDSSTPDERNQSNDDPLYHRPIKRINKYGHGVVEIDGEFISIGPVSEDAVGYEAAVIPIGDGFGVCKTLSVRKENYFKNYLGRIDDVLIDTLNHYEVGMTVRDRQEEFIQKAVVVNLPPIPAKDYVLYHDGQKEVTVEDENPEYDRLVSVVIVVSEKTLQKHFPEYDGGTIPLKMLSEQGIEHYAYPPERLRPMEDDMPDYDGLISVSETNTRDFKQKFSETSPSDPDDVLAGDDSPHKYKAGLSQSESSVERSEKEGQTEINNSSSAEAETPIKSTNNKKEKRSQKEDKEFCSPEDESTESISDPSKSEIKEPTDDTYGEEEEVETATTDSSVVVDGSTDPQERSVNNTSEIKNEGARNEASLDELRERAKENEVEEITQEVSTTNTTEKTQYHRSPEIKEYVKARAEGCCEGCGKPAPFTDKTGDPYLHAHHVHELSDGGSDTVDTVIALCPNCHYRVHHGGDGEKYNQKLLEKVQRLENN